MEKFDFKYKNSWQLNSRHKTLITKMESGKEQRRGKGQKRRRFVLEFDKTSNFNNDAQEILDFFNEHEGELFAFLWDYVHPDGAVEEVTVRFNQSEFSAEAFKDKAHSFTLELIEVI